MKISTATIIAIIALSAAQTWSTITPPGKTAATSNHAVAVAINSPRHTTLLSLEDRIAYQRAIEEVYWRHRTWPKENGRAKPSLDEVMPHATIEKKVKDYLRNSQLLEQYWQKPITPEQLQAEMDRMARQTRQPDVLREIFAAVGNDPAVIAECVARPALAERLVTNLYAHDKRFHGELKQRALTELADYHAVAQMKKTSAKYTELEWVKTDRADDRGCDSNAQQADAINMTESEWNDNVGKIAATFGNSIAGQGVENVAKLARSNVNRATCEALPIGKVSSLREDDVSYYATAVLSKSKDRLKIATVAWMKLPLEEWRTHAATALPVTMKARVRAGYKLPTITATTQSCTDDTWQPTQATAPNARLYHTAVWTGSEMIIWGGEANGNDLASGGRYNPSTDTWAASTSVNAPEARNANSAVWTGSEMIILAGVGGYGNTYFDTGGAYNPVSDTWRTISNVGAPSPRYGHTAVWTGNEMIVWGGYLGYTGNDDPYGPLDTGGRYNPNTDSWTATSSANAPGARVGHAAVWSGAKMVVWGGRDSSNADVATGGQYDPANDTWTVTATTNAPDGRINATAIWTGSEMIIWGGGYDVGLDTGGAYNPVSDSWRTISNVGAPSPRTAHTAVWSGSLMIVWGGYSHWTGTLNSGGQYDPITDSWTATATDDAPVARSLHTAVWTGSEMIVWGGGGAGNNNGYFDSGGRYNPTADSWTSTNNMSPRVEHTAIWTGNEMIVWGGSNAFYQVVNTGGRYSPATDNWTPTSTAGAPDARHYHTAVWTGTNMVIWGGLTAFGGESNSGGRYDPATDQWLATSTVNAPFNRAYHTATWTGSEMIVWGGLGSGLFNTGGRYNPVTDTWVPTDTSGAPTARYLHTAVFATGKMIVWGGYTSGGSSNTGAQYDPSTDGWISTNTANAPDGRYSHTTVWTGNEMIVWGGYNNFGYLDTGGRYNPSADSWTVTSTTNAPEPRYSHTAVWTGSEMIVWGGYGNISGLLNTGGRYNRGTDSWTVTSTTNASEPRYSHTAVWTGSEMIVWGGYGPNGILGTGGRYCAPATAPVAVSRKNHGGTNYDLPLPLTGSPAIECRSGGGSSVYQLVVGFSSAVVFDHASVTSGSGTVTATSGSGTATATIDLSGITNQQTINVTLFGLHDGSGTRDLVIPMGILLGDVDASGRTDAGDVTAVRNHTVSIPDSLTFRYDVNASGRIDAGDVTATRNATVTVLP